MRKYAVVVLLISLVSATAVSVIGQEEPLPPVTPKAVASDVASDLPPVVLVVEPIREFHQPTLAEAARKNDFVTFDALYREAKASGENVSAYETLHELWTYSITDPIGAFYGAEIHDRLAAAYPDYAKFIDDYRIVDSRGNVFYPTSETRAFLLTKANEARAPRVQIASSQSGERKAVSGEEPAAKPRRTAPNVAPAPKVVAPTTTPAVVAEPVAPPQVAVQEPAPQPAPVSALPSPLSAPEPAQTAPQPAPAKAPASDILATRGILLLVIGLIGIGVLAVMLRTPRETPQVSVLKTEPEKPAAPVAPVEPLRRPTAPKAEGPRATGSHG